MQMGRSKSTRESLEDVALVHVRRSSLFRECTLKKPLRWRVKRVLFMPRVEVSAIKVTYYAVGASEVMARIAAILAVGGRILARDASNIISLSKRAIRFQFANMKNEL